MRKCRGKRKKLLYLIQQPVHVLSFQFQFQRMHCACVCCRFFPHALWGFCLLFFLEFFSSLVMFILGLWWSCMGMENVFWTVCMTRSHSVCLPLLSAGWKFAPFWPFTVTLHCLMLSFLDISGLLDAPYCEVSFLVFLCWLYISAVPWCSTHREVVLVNRSVSAIRETASS